MTRRGSPDERRWRRRRNLEPGSDGSIHGEQPVDPRGRHPREKPSGHRHTEDQPPEEHGSGKHDSTVADNPHGQGTHDSTVAANPHGNATHSPGMVENPTSSAPSLRRGTRASQPTPSNVAVGSRYVVEDEQEVEEVAADTTGDNAADTWLVVGTDPTHDHDSRYVNDTGDTMTGKLFIDATSDPIELQRVGVSKIRDLDINGPAVGIEADDGTTSFRVDVRLDTAGLDVPGRIDATSLIRSTRDSPVALQAFRDTIGYATLGVTDDGHAILTVRDASFNELSNIQVTTDGRLYAPDDMQVVGSLETSHGFVPTEFVTANESDTQNKRNSDHDADGTDDHVTIQNAIDALPVGTK